jgi:VRR-NUC domain-containing protein
LKNITTLATTAITRRARFAPPKARTSRRVPEWRLQAAIMAKLHKLEAEGWPFTSAGDQNAERRGKLAAAKAKVTGMTPGEPDIRVYLSNGRLGLIELKAKDGTLSDAQEERHERLAELGHNVVVLRAVTEKEAVDGAVKILKELLEKAA